MKIKKTNKLPGGLADDAGLSSFDMKELKKGIEHEKEHTKDLEIAAEVASDHMVEDPKYYTHMKEKGLDETKSKISLTKYWKRRAKIRAKRAGRHYPNGTDKNWAYEQQQKSKSVDDKLKNIFSDSEESIKNIQEAIKKKKWGILKKNFKGIVPPKNKIVHPSFTEPGGLYTENKEMESILEILNEGPYIYIEDGEMTIDPYFEKNRVIGDVFYKEKKNILMPVNVNSEIYYVWFSPDGKALMSNNKEKLPHDNNTIFYDDPKPQPLVIMEQQELKGQVKNLFVFDFDNTLLNPPEQPSNYDGNWFASKESLDGVSESSWKEQIVDAARNSLEGTENYCVVLTGRKDYFKDKISELVSAKGLDFDDVICTPYGEDTKKFKLQTINSLKQQFPSLQSVILYNDDDEENEFFKGSLKDKKVKTKLFIVK